eukprot:CAMPEP_0119468782 /NCGR_PEP_ID=MMETSP1344-20130328/2386_1 /TAXON_ID=236787 /ORGANISM="Florenciella parvula, Strain CCMP2471" /LENGTH=134 /DNA_ID=CAMNT_0007501275 /DNA_START=136 /DNA_END=540 /DNA_ORIENTATION=+
MEILPTPAHNWWGTPDAQAVQERAAEFIEANFLQESYTNKYGVPNEGPGLAVAVLKTGAFQLTKTGVLGKGDADAILRRHNATLLDPAALGEVSDAHVYHLFIPSWYPALLDPAKLGELSRCAPPRIQQRRVPA